MTGHCGVALLLSALILALGMESDPNTGSYVVHALAWKLGALGTSLGYLACAATITLRRHRLA